MIRVVTLLAVLAAASSISQADDQPVWKATLGDLVRWAAEKAPGFHAKITSPEDADIVRDSTLRDGMWGAYDISRITAETGWRPRPVREALHAYMEWICTERKP